MGNFGKATQGEVFTQKYKVTFNDIDPEYRLKPVSAIGMFQDTVAAYMTVGGFSLFDLNKQGYTWVIPDHVVEFCGKAPLWRNDVIVDLCPTEISSTKFFFDFVIMDGDRNVFAKGTGTWSPINIETARPVPMTEIIEVEGEPSVKHGRLLFPAVNRKEEADGLNYMCYQRVTDSTDIDFNWHVNNLSYLKQALSCFPMDYLKTHSLGGLSIKFMRQCFLGDMLTCCSEKVAMDQESDADRFNCSITNGEGTEVCRMVLTMVPAPVSAPVADIVSRIK